MTATFLAYVFPVLLFLPGVSSGEEEPPCAPPAVGSTTIAPCPPDDTTCAARLSACLEQPLGGRARVASFIDNGDGTISDLRTGLMWEKLGDDGSIHDADNTYNYTNAFTRMATLNAANFAGYSDWRLPNLNELRSLVSYSAFNPAVHVPFRTNCATGCSNLVCSCTRSSLYWSSTAYQDSSSYAWVVNFYDGYTLVLDKRGNNYVRAVRGGS